MPTLTIDEAQSRLPQLIDQLRPGEEVVITRDDKPVARLTAEWPIGVPVPGRCKGMLTVHAEDDEHLEGFAESAGLMPPTASPPPPRRAATPSGGPPRP